MRLLAIFRVECDFRDVEGVIRLEKGVEGLLGALVA